MKVLKGIISDSWGYYQNIRAQLEKKLMQLPRGSVKKRILGNQVYYYHQYREGEKVVHKYLGKDRPEKLEREAKERRDVTHQLHEVKKSIKLLSKVYPYT